MLVFRKINIQEEDDLDGTKSINGSVRGSESCLFYISGYLYIEYFIRNRPKYSIRFVICIVKKYNIIEQTGRKCKKYSMKL